MELQEELDRKENKDVWGENHLKKFQIDLLNAADAKKTAKDMRVKVKESAAKS